MINRCCAVEWTWPEPDLSSRPIYTPPSLSSSSLTLFLVKMSCSHPSQSPLPPTEEKVAPVASLQPPSYQVAAGVPLPPPPPPEHEDSQLSRCRRRYRRFAPFLVAAVFLWLAS